MSFSRVFWFGFQRLFYAALVSYYEPLHDAQSRIMCAPDKDVSRKLRSARDGYRKASDGLYRELA